MSKRNKRNRNDDENSIYDKIDMRILDSMDDLQNFFDTTHPSSPTIENNSLGSPPTIKKSKQNSPTNQRIQNISKGIRDISIELQQVEETLQKLERELETSETSNRKPPKINNKQKQKKKLEKMAKTMGPSLM